MLLLLMLSVGFFFTKNNIESTLSINFCSKNRDDLRFCRLFVISEDRETAKFELRKPAQIETNGLDCMDEVTVHKKVYFRYLKEAVIITGFLLMAQTSTNRAQTNGTGSEIFGRHGVESDVTASILFVISKKRKYI